MRLCRWWWRIRRCNRRTKLSALYGLKYPWPGRPCWAQPSRCAPRIWELPFLIQQHWQRRTRRLAIPKSFHIVTLGVRMRERRFLCALLLVSGS